MCHRRRDRETITAPTTSTMTTTTPMKTGCDVRRWSRWREGAHPTPKHARGASRGVNLSELRLLHTSAGNPRPTWLRTLPPLQRGTNALTDDHAPCSQAGDRHPRSSGMYENVCLARPIGTTTSASHPPAGPSPPPPRAPTPGPPQGTAPTPPPPPSTRSERGSRTFAPDSCQAIAVELVVSPGKEKNRVTGVSAKPACLPPAGQRRVLAVLRYPGTRGSVR